MTAFDSAAQSDVRYLMSSLEEQNQTLEADERIYFSSQCLMRLSNIWYSAKPELCLKMTAGNCPGKSGAIHLRTYIICESNYHGQFLRSQNKIILKYSTKHPIHSNLCLCLMQPHSHRISRTRSKRNTKTNLLLRVHILNLIKPL